MLEPVLLRSGDEARSADEDCLVGFRVSPYLMAALGLTVKSVTIVLQDAGHLVILHRVVDAGIC